MNARKTCEYFTFVLFLVGVEGVALRALKNYASNGTKCVFYIKFQLNEIKFRFFGIRPWH